MNAVSRLHTKHRSSLKKRIGMRLPVGGVVIADEYRNIQSMVRKQVTLPSESVSHNWLYFVVVVAVDKWEAAFCFPLIHSLFSSVARRQLAIAAVLRFQSCSNCVGLT